MSFTQSLSGQSLLLRSNMTWFASASLEPIHRIWGREIEVYFSITSHGSAPIHWSIGRSVVGPFMVSPHLSGWIVLSHNDLSLLDTPLAGGARYLLQSILVQRPLEKRSIDSPVNSSIDYSRACAVHIVSSRLLCHVISRLLVALFTSPACGKQTCLSVDHM